MKFEDLEKVPVGELSPTEVRVIMACKLFPTSEQKNACMHGFKEGIVYSREKLKVYAKYF